MSMSDSAVTAATSRKPTLRGDEKGQAASPTTAASPQFEDAHVIVSVRARPLNQRELAWAAEAQQQQGQRCSSSSSTGEKRAASTGSSETLLISQDGKNMVILERGVPAKFKEWTVEAQNLYINGLSGSGCHRFAFDHIYGPTSTQEELYQDIGRGVLASSMKGFHTCIFAYGQTGSGKSYSMMGPDGGAGLEKDPGLVPRLCEALFDEMAARQAENAARLAEAMQDNGVVGSGGEASASAAGMLAEAEAVAPAALPSEVEFCVYVSYLEIYRERVRCLLGGTSSTSSSTNKRNRKRVSSSSPSRPETATEAGLHTLRVRQHPTLGVYVEGLKEVPVERKEQMLKLMSVGNFNRHTAATRMNDTSSRSHAIFTITVVQRRKGKTRGGDEKITELRSKMNLVDLAGSERVQSTGAEGEVLKEGALINLSLTTLGLVISVLADNSQQQQQQQQQGGSSPSRSKEKHVPYRDSTLTFLLKESLGGSSKTFMLSNISPSIMHYDETLSTLRFADRAKSIVTRAFVNESAGDRRIRELENEVNRLRETIRMLQSQSSAHPTAAAALLPPSTGAAEASQSRRNSRTVSTDSFTDLEEEEGDAADEKREEKDPSETRSQKTEDASEEVDNDLDEDELQRNSTAAPYDAQPVESPTTALDDIGLDLAPRVDVNALQQELARAEDAIRQMTATEAEREAETAAVLQSLKEREEELARHSATMRLARSDPYLLNVDGIGNWVAAYLSKPWTSLGAVPEGEKKNNNGSFHKDDEETQYLFIPCEDADAIGEPHILFSRDLVTSCVRACPSLGCSTFLNYSPIPLLGKETTLHSGDVLSLGHVDGPQFRFIDPAEPPTTARGARTVSRPLGGAHSLSPAASPVAVRPTHVDAEPPKEEEEASSPIAFDPTVEKHAPEGSRGPSTWSDSVAGGMSQPGGDHTDAIRGPSLFSVTSRTLHSADFNSPPGVDNGGDAEKECEETESPVDRRRGGTTASAAPTEREDVMEEEEDGPSPSPRAPDAPLPRLDFSPFASRGNTSSAAGLTVGVGKTSPAANTTLTPIAKQGISGDGKKFLSPPSNKPQADKDARPCAQDGTAAGAGATISTEPQTEPFETFNEERRLLNRHSFVLLGESGVGKTSFKENLRRVNDALLSSANAAHPQQGNPKEKDAFQHFISNLFRKEEYREETPTACIAPSVAPTFGLQSTTISVRKGVSGDPNDDDNTMQLVFFDIAGAPCFLPLLEVVPSRRVTYVLAFSLVTRVAPSAPAGETGSDSEGFSAVLSPQTIQPASPSLELFKTTLELILSRTDNRDVSILLLATQADLFLRCYRNAAARRPGQEPLPSSHRQGASSVPGMQEMHEVISMLEQEVQNYLQLLQPNAAIRPVIVGRFAVDSIHSFANTPAPKPQPWSPFEKHNKAPAAPQGQEVYSFDFANVRSWRELLWWISDHAQQCCRQDVDFPNGLVPARCFTHLEDVLGQIRQTHKWCLSVSDYRQLAKSVHPHYKVARSDLYAQTQLLQNFGVLYHHFRHALLKKFVILDTTWLHQLFSVVAACGFVTVKPSPAASGDHRRRREVLVASPEALTPYCNRSKAKKSDANSPSVSAAKDSSSSVFGTLPFDPLQVILADRYHLLPQGVLSFHVLSVLLASMTRSPVQNTNDKSSGGAGSPVKRKNSYFSQLPDLLGVVEFLEMCDLVIRGSRVRYSDFRLNAKPFATATAAATTTTATRVGRPAQGCQKGQVVSTDSLNASSSSTNTTTPTGGTPHGTGAVVKVRGRVISPGYDAANKDQTSAAPTSANDTPRTDASGGALEPFRRRQPKSVWETFLLLPSNFQQKPPNCVILHFSKFLSGPFYRFRLRMAPVFFFSKLVSRLAASVDVVTGVYIGPLHSQPILAESPAIPVSSFTNEAAATDNDGSRSSSTAGGAATSPVPSSSPAGLVPTASSCATLWQRTVWVVGRGSCRAFVRMIGHTLFVSFHAHPPPSGDREGSYSGQSLHDECMDYFYDAIVSTVRQVVEENPGVECDESLFCAAGYDVVWQTTEGRLFAAKSTDGDTSVVDGSDDEIDITTSEGQKEHVFYRAIDENINTLQKIRERDMFALQTARSVRDGSTRASVTSPRQESELEEFDSFLGSHGEGEHLHEAEQEKEATVVPFMRTRTADTPPIDAGVFVRTITSGHPDRMNEMQQAGCRVAIDLYNKSFATSHPLAAVGVNDGSAGGGSSSDALDKLLDVLAHLAL